MTERISIEFKAAEGAVSRVLGLVERRGFRVRGLSMAEQGESGSLTMDVDIRDAGRRLDVLGLQLSRLAEVSSVSFSDPGSGALQ